MLRDRERPSQGQGRGRTGAGVHPLIGRGQNVLGAIRRALGYGRQRWLRERRFRWISTALVLTLGGGVTWPWWAADRYAGEFEAVVHGLGDGSRPAWLAARARIEGIAAVEDENAQVLGMVAVIEALAIADGHVEVSRARPHFDSPELDPGLGRLARAIAELAQPRAVVGYELQSGAGAEARLGLWLSARRVLAGLNAEPTPWRVAENLLRSVEAVLGTHPHDLRLLLVGHELVLAQHGPRSALNWLRDHLQPGPDGRLPAQLDVAGIYLSILSGDHVSENLQRIEAMLDAPKGTPDATVLQGVGPWARARAHLARAVIDCRRAYFDACGEGLDEAVAFAPAWDLQLRLTAIEWAAFAGFEGRAQAWLEVIDTQYGDGGSVAAWREGAELAVALGQGRADDVVHRLQILGDTVGEPDGHGVARRPHWYARMRAYACAEYGDCGLSLREGSAGAPAETLELEVAQLRAGDVASRSEAVARLRWLGARWPGLTRVWTGLGQLEARRMKAEGTEQKEQEEVLRRAFSAAVAHEPRADWALRALAELHLAAAHTSDRWRARDYLWQAVRENPHDLVSRRRWATLLFEQGSRDAVLRMPEAPAADGPLVVMQAGALAAGIRRHYLHRGLFENASGWPVELAGAEVQENKWSSLRRRFDNGVKLPESAQVNLQIAVTSFAEASQPDRAQLLARLLRRLADHPGDHELRAMSIRLTAQVEGFSTAADRAAVELRTGPKAAAAAIHRVLAELELEEGRPQVAARRARLAWGAVRDPRHPAHAAMSVAEALSIAELASELWLKQGYWGDALLFTRQATERWPDHPVALRLRASVALRAKKLTIACPAARRGYELDPGDPALSALRAACAQARGRPKAAARVWEQAARRSNFDALAAHYRARAAKLK